MKKLILILSLIPSASLMAAEKQAIVQTSQLLNLPREMQLSIIEQRMNDIKNLESLIQVLKDIAQLKQTSRQFRDLVNKEENKRFLLNKLNEQIKEYKIPGAKFWKAVQLKSPILAEALIASGADVNEKDEFGATALHYATGYFLKGSDAERIMQILIKNGADVNARDEDGQTPLHVAADADAKDEAKLLIENNANVSAKNRLGETPLHRAAMFGESKEVAELLVEKDADVMARNNDRETPLDLAKTPEMKQLLQEAMKKQSAGN